MHARQMPLAPLFTAPRRLELHSVATATPISWRKEGSEACAGNCATRVGFSVVLLAGADMPSYREGGRSEVMVARRDPRRARRPAPRLGAEVLGSGDVLAQSLSLPRNDAARNVAERSVNKWLVARLQKCRSMDR